MRLPEDDTVSRDLAFDQPPGRSITIDTIAARVPLSHSRQSSAEASSAVSHASSAAGLTSPRAGPPIPLPPLPVEPPKPAGYGHHRQTSIVHGIQHSRNGSVASPTTASPLSPQIIAAAGSTLDMQSLGARLEPDFGATVRGPVGIGLQGSNAMGMPGALERSPSNVDLPLQGQQPPRSHERSKSRREQPGHHPSLSRHHKEEQKTVGEYALHVLFTSVC